MPKTLEEQLRKSLEYVGPSLTPGPRLVKESEPAPDIRDVVASGALRLKILRLSQASLEYAQQEKEAKTARDGINNELKALMKDLPEKRFIADGNLLCYYSMERSTLNKDKLLNAGVKPSVITACTDVSTSWGLRITPQGEKE